MTRGKVLKAGLEWIIIVRIRFPFFFTIPSVILYFQILVLYISALFTFQHYFCKFYFYSLYFKLFLTLIFTYCIVLTLGILNLIAISFVYFGFISCLCFYFIYYIYCLLFWLSFPWVVSRFLLGYVIGSTITYLVKQWC